MAIVDPEVKFFHVLDRLSRDSYKYVQCCLLCLIEGIADIVPLIFSSIADELSNLLLGNKPSSLLPSEFDHRLTRLRSDFETLSSPSLSSASNMPHIGIILDLMHAQCVKNRIVSYGFLKSIAILLESLNNSNSDEDGG